MDINQAVEKKLKLLENLVLDFFKEKTEKYSICASALANVLDPENMTDEEIRGWKSVIIYCRKQAVKNDDVFKKFIEKIEVKQ